MPNAKSQMGPKTERTPGEWETSFNGKDWDICVEGGGDMIADLKDCPNAEADAAFIVKACNNHEALVDTLHYLETILSEEGRNMASERRWVVIHPDTQVATLIWAETEEEAWDKYAKATGIDVSLDEMWKWNSWEMIAVETELK